MNSCLWFGLGLLVGGILGVATMCIVQTGRSDEFDELFDDDYEDEDWEGLYE